MAGSGRIATITVTDVEDPATARAVVEGLTRSSQDAAGPPAFRPLTLSVRRPGDAAPAGGLVGHTVYAWLFVRIFWLPEDLRRHGLGSALLRRAEAEALARGCVGVHLDTFSFQARPFYERHGYTVFGELEDTPPGHRRYFMMKRLDGATAPLAEGEGTRHVSTGR